MAEKSFAEQFGKPIPEWLYSENTKQPFANCTLCHQNLTNVKYTICKSFSRLSLEDSFVLNFELVMCQDCSETYSNNFSKETLSAFEKLAKEYPGLSPNIQIVITDVYKDYLPKPICAVTKKTMEELYEYELSAYVSENLVIGSANLLGEKAIKLLDDCLSDESSGFMDDFFNSLIDLPPEISTILKEKKIIF
ncbi:hypothetical protein [Kordia zhangzhouensis]|uniref:hypothetical protein n=1 Tax=Kordia zhangzhouensis TaxID=1620405 RepID=UPI00062932DA|nr:hypothetical protein [Kordia zhangzhouensis]